MCTFRALPAASPPPPARPFRLVPALKIIVTVHPSLPEFSAGSEVIALGMVELQGRGQVVVVTGSFDPHPLRDEDDTCAAG